MFKEFKFKNEEECGSRASSADYFIKKPDLVKIIKKYPEVEKLMSSNYNKLSKDKIWKDTSIETTIFVKNLKLYGYTDGKKLCDDMRDTFILIIDQMIPPTGEVVEKDF